MTNQNLFENEFDFSVANEKNFLSEIDRLDQTLSSSAVDREFGLASEAVLQAVAPLPVENAIEFVARSTNDVSPSSFVAEPQEVTNLSSFTQDIYPRIVINDAIGPAGSREYAAEFDAVVQIGGCSGTLIASDVVLTARHCGIFPGDRVAFGPNSFNPDFTTTVESASNPGGGSFFSPLLDGGDVTIARLVTDVPETVATPMRLANATELVGERVAIVGYGLNGVGSEGHQFSSDGFRWGGENIIDTVGEAAGTFGLTSNIISTDFDDDSGFGNTIPGSNPTPLEFEATTAGGDSGGPILINSNSEWLIAGVLSGGTSPFSTYGDISWWTGIGIYEQQITDAGGEFTSGTPDVDDHVDTFPGASTTFLQFNSLAKNFVGRNTGVIGFEDVVDDTDVFGFSTGSLGRIIVDVRSQSSGLDPILEFYDSEGELIGLNNNASNPAISNPLDSQLIIKNLPAGEYFVAVKSVGDTTGDYRVAVRHNAVLGGVDDVGSSFPTSAIVGLNPAPGTTFINAAIDFGEDRDFYEFTANVTGRIVIRSKALDEESDLNTVLRGYDSERNLLDANNNFRGSLDSRIVLDVEEGERYFVQLNSVRETRGNYRISLRLNNDAVGGSDGFGDFGRDRLASSETALRLANPTDEILNGGLTANSETFPGFLS